MDKVAEKQLLNDFLAKYEEEVRKIEAEDYSVEIKEQVEAFEKELVRKYDMDKQKRIQEQKYYIVATKNILERFEKENLSEENCEM
ncbi:MAG: hypothetical protein KBS91_03930 [Firmicutes bacterium]|nr:hypothetical protein [Candidatus Caballimonas caccae]